MKKSSWAVGLGIAAVVVVAGVLGTSYYMGGKLENEFKAQIDRLNSEQANQVTVVSYERGLFTSTAQTQWSMQPWGIPGHAKVDHQITHGPLPAGSAAQVHSQVRIDSGNADTNQELLAALHGRPFMDVVSTFDWGSNSSHQLTSPELGFMHGKYGITWGGMKADWSMTADLRSFKGTTENPSITVKNEADGKLMTLGRTTTAFDLRSRPDITFWSGPFNMAVDNFAAESKGDEKTHPSSFKLQKLAFDSDTIVKGETTELPLKLTVQSVQTDNFNGEAMVLEGVARNLDTGWLNESTEWIGQFNAAMTRSSLQIAKQALIGAEADDEEIDTDVSAAMAGMPQLTPEMLARNPELEIKRASIRTPEGVSEFSALVAYAENKEAPENRLMNWKFDLKADLSKPMIIKMMATKTRNAIVALMDSIKQKYDPEEISQSVNRAMSQRLQALIVAGPFEETADKLSTHISMVDGETKVNDKTIDMGAAVGMLLSMSNWWNSEH